MLHPHAERLHAPIPAAPAGTLIHPQVVMTAAHVSRWGCRWDAPPRRLVHPAASPVRHQPPRRAAVPAPCSRAAPPRSYAPQCASIYSSASVRLGGYRRTQDAAGEYVERTTTTRVIHPGFADAFAPAGQANVDYLNNVREGGCGRRGSCGCGTGLQHAASRSPARATPAARPG